MFCSGIFVVLKDVFLLNVCRSYRNSFCIYWYKDFWCCMYFLYLLNYREKLDRGLICMMVKEIWLYERVVVFVGVGKFYDKVNKVFYFVF